MIRIYFRNTKRQAHRNGEKNRARESEPAREQLIFEFPAYDWLKMTCFITMTKTRQRPGQSHFQGGVCGLPVCSRTMRSVSKADFTTGRSNI